MDYRLQPAPRAEVSVFERGSCFSHLAFFYFLPFPATLGSMTVMEDFPIAPTLVIKDTPKPRHLKTMKDARDYVEEEMRIGRPEPWREVLRRLKAVTGEEDAFEAIGDLRELLAEEDLLLPSGVNPKA
jgi:hypothetical protein